MLRKREYEINCLQGIKRLLMLPLIMVHKYRFHRLSLLLNFTIPLNAIGPGFSIAHPGTIVINPEARIGKNCRIQTGVTIGSTNGSEKAPIIGDNVFLGDGCKIIGDIRIADDVAIGANAVVVKSILESGTTWGGVPAKKISNNDSRSCLSPFVEF
ncbi:MAG: serine O-acetyltransferase [Candidatus Ornithospirochaeta sp.]